MVIITKDMWENISRLDKEDRGKVLEAVIGYYFGEEEFTDDDAIVCTMIDLIEK